MNIKIIYSNEWKIMATIVVKLYGKLVLNMYCSTALMLNVLYPME